MQNEGVGPVVAMINDSTSGWASAERDLIAFVGNFDFGKSLCITEGNRWFDPAIVSEDCVALRESCEQRCVDAHIGDGIAKGIWQSDQHVIRR